MEFSFYFASRLQLGSDTELIQVVLLNNLFPNHNGDVASVDAYQMGRFGIVCKIFLISHSRNFCCLSSKSFGLHFTLEDSGESSSLD